MPTIPELKALYQKGAARNNMDPIFQTTGYWVWSGELRDASSAWFFSFTLGQEYGALASPATHGRLRCVPAKEVRLGRRREKFKTRILPNQSLPSSNLRSPRSLPLSQSFQGKPGISPEMAG